MAMFDYDVPKIRDYWIDQVKIELGEAMSKFSKFNSNHEGYAVLKEEVDELWDNIKGNVAQELTRKEAVQVAAMALRFLIDCQTGETLWGTIVNR